jgi:hypothetical protein
MKKMGFQRSSEQDNSTTTDTNNITVPLDITNAVVFGQTGCGKTTSFIYKNLEQRIKMGHSILFFDYKGNEHAVVKYLANQAGRIKDIVEVGKTWNTPLQLLGDMSEKELETFIDSLIGNDSGFDFWNNGARSLAKDILSSLKLLDELLLYCPDLQNLFSEIFVLNIKIGSKSFCSFENLIQIVRSTKKTRNYCSSFEQLTEYNALKFSYKIPPSFIS